MRARRFAQIAVACALLGGALVWVLLPPPAPEWNTDYDTTAKPPEAIAPGALVERGPPVGWSHLVIKSLPRVRASEVPKLPRNPLVSRDKLVEMTAWMFTAFAADVVREEHGSHARYKLRAIGLGLGASANGRDTVFTADTAARFGIELDFIRKEVITTSYRVQERARVLALGPSFAVLDTPVTYRCGDRNRMIRFRYALIVDTKTGALDVLCWRVGDEPAHSDLTCAVLLHPNLVDEAQLVADPKGFSLAGIPGELAFGVDALPPHRLEVPLPEALRALAGASRFTPSEVRQLELNLRGLLHGRV
jgi:hypothetical protein